MSGEEILESQSERTPAALPPHSRCTSPKFMLALHMHRGRTGRFLISLFTRSTASLFHATAVLACCTIFEFVCVFFFLLGEIQETSSMEPETGSVSERPSNFKIGQGISSEIRLIRPAMRSENRPDRKP